MFKFFLIFISIISFPYILVSVEVDKEKFLILMNEEWEAIEGHDKLLWDASDIYLYYYLRGKTAGLLEAKKIFESCVIE